jgi:hypothetical protein
MSNVDLLKGGLPHQQRDHGATGLTQIRYSKFRRGNGVSMGVGRLIFDGIPLLFAIGYAMTITAAAAPIQWIMSILFVLYFGKRCVEAIFIHRYSGPIDVLAVVQITGRATFPQMAGSVCDILPGLV